MTRNDSETAAAIRRAETAAILAARGLTRDDIARYDHEMLTGRRARICEGRYAFQDNANAACGSRETHPRHAF